MPQLQLKSLSKRYTGFNGETAQALQDFSLEIASDELLAVVGPSASGKTTLLRLIAGLEQADSGQIIAGGTEISDQPARNRNTAMVFQSLALYPHLTAAENIGFGLRLRNYPKLEIRDRTRRIAERLNISNCLGRKPFELSGGQRQRVALARALARQPAILLLDEPFSHLDGPLRRNLCRELRTVHQEFQLTTLLVTHEIAEANAVGHRIAILNQGRLEQVGSIESIRTHPATPFVSEFIQSQLI